MELKEEERKKEEKPGKQTLIAVALLVQNKMQNPELVSPSPP